MILVEEVSLEHCLCCWVLQVDLILLDRISILPLLIVNVILVEVVAILAGLVGSYQVSVLEGQPVEILEPRMLLNFHVSIVAEPA